MSTWARIDENNIVIDVLRCDNNDPNGDEGFKWLTENFGGTWIQTSFIGAIRKNYAGIGYTYDAERDAFIAPEPEGNIGFNEETCTWIMPERIIE